MSRAFLTGSGGRLFRGVWTRLPGVMRGVVEDGGARSAGKRAAPSLTMVSADWRGAERGEAGPAVMTRSSHLRVCWGNRLERNAIKKEYESLLFFEIVLLSRLFALPLRTVQHRQVATGSQCRGKQ